MEDARCVYCNSDDVEYTGEEEETGLDEYFCHSCKQYLVLDWDEIDANNVIDEKEYPIGYSDDGSEFAEDFINEEYEEGYE